MQSGNTSGAAQAPHLCSLQSYGYSLCMRVTVGHLRVSDVTLCSTCCGCSSHPRKSLRAHVPLHHPLSSSKEYIGCTDCALQDACAASNSTIELTLSQYPTVRQCSVREGGTRFFLCSCNKREDALEPTMSVTVGHIKVPDVTLPMCNQGTLRAPPKPHISAVYSHTAIVYA